MRYLVASLIVLGCLSSAHALVVGPGGTITDWGITPFSNWSTPDGAFGDGGVNNNWSPIDYPSGVGHRPSPGGATGELFDLEGLYGRRVGDNFQALLVTSMPLYTTITSGGYHYRLGDLFLNTDDDGAYEFALITQDSNQHGFSGGELRQVTATHGVVSDHSGYGGYPGIAGLVNPWTLAQGELAAEGQLNSAFYGGYAGGTEPTYLYEWTIPFAALNVGPGQQIKLHMTVECGNDLIETGGTIPIDVPPIPEPTTVVLIGSALVALVRHARRNGLRVGGNAGR